jgi:hypothetical protein
MKEGCCCCCSGCVELSDADGKDNEVGFGGGGGNAKIAPEKHCTFGSDSNNVEVVTSSAAVEYKHNPEDDAMEF